MKLTVKYLKALMWMSSCLEKKKEQKMTEVKPIEGLEFEESTHTYRLNGFVIPSVSAVMEPLNRDKYKGISESVLDVAANRGTAIHNAIENYIRFGIVDIPEDFKGYMDAFIDWHTLRNPQPIVLEYRTCHKILRYGGTVDNVSEINGVPTLIDYKTTVAENSKTFGVQLEAYAKCLEGQGINIGRKMILHLAKNGKWKEVEYPVNDAEKWAVFSSLKVVYDYIHK